jgi:hypothetical protein
MYKISEISKVTPDPDDISGLLEVIDLKGLNNKTIGQTKKFESQKDKQILESITFQ